MGFGKVVWETLIQWSETTSIAGIGPVCSRKGYAKKAYWLILFLIMLYLTIHGLVSTIESFYEREITTSTDLDFSPSVAFPAVSICNMNK